MTEAITIRDYSSNDFAFIINSWLKSYQTSSLFTEDIKPKVYFKFHKFLIEQILNRKSSTVCVAVASDDPELIYGYAIFEKMGEYEVFHYIYVKRGFNHFGIAQKLIESAPFLVKSGVFCSHLTYRGHKLRKSLGLIYNPYLI